MKVITTPNGTIGSHLLTMLGGPLSVVSYQPEKLPRIEGRVLRGSTDDPRILQEAFAGADTVFWCVPQSLRWTDSRAYYRRFTDAAIAAAKVHSPRIVTISSGGYGAPNAGPATTLNEMEDLWNATGLPTRHLRCGYFMENLLWSVETLRAPGGLFFPVEAGSPLPFVAARDIAATAAHLMADPSWKDQRAIPVYGPADLTFTEVSRILGEILDKPIFFARAAPAEVREAFRRLGSNDGWIDEYLAMSEAFSQGSYRRDARSADATAAVPLADWAREVLLPAYRAAHRRPE